MMKNFIQLIIFVLPLFWFVYGLKDLNNLMGDGIYLFIYFIIYTCFTIRDINERCYRIEKKVMSLINFEEEKEVNKRFEKIKKYNED